MIRHTIGIGLAGLFAGAAGASDGAGQVRYFEIPVGVYYGTKQAAREAYDVGRFDEAFERYSLAARWGETDAQYQLGLMYLDGKGTQPNDLLAYIWLKLAADSGYKPWVRTAQSMDRNLTPEQLQYAENQVRKYRSQFGIEANGIICGKPMRAHPNRNEAHCARPRSSDQIYFRLRTDFDL